MRKIYQKPEIVFEDFSLSENIAAGCEIIIPGPVSGSCGYAPEGSDGRTLFLLGVNGCDIPVNDDPTNGFCYHTPIEGNNLFNS